MTQRDDLTIESELAPIFDAVGDGLGCFESLESNLVVHFRGCRVSVGNVENDGIVRFGFE